MGVCSLLHNLFLNRVSPRPDVSVPRWGGAWTLLNVKRECATQIVTNLEGVGVASSSFSFVPSSRSSSNPLPTRALPELSPEHPIEKRNLHDNFSICNPHRESDLDTTDAGRS
jgi:hypothetical protein